MQKAFAGEKMRNNRLEQFKDECRAAAARDERAQRWEWSFDPQDFGREWYVTVREGRNEATVNLQSARVTPTTATDILQQLGRMLDELSQG